MDKTNFHDKQIFGQGFQPGLKSCMPGIGTLFQEDILKLDGTINLERMGKVTKTVVWTYIYYLWYYNKETVEVFKKMTDDSQKVKKASATLFSVAVKEYIQKQNPDKILSKARTFSKENLVSFVNDTVKENKDIKIPVLQQLYKKLLNASRNNQSVNIALKKQNNTSNNLQPATATATTTQVTATSNKNAVVVLDPKEMTNSDIKVQFGINLFPKK
jgi:hypothetical protein